MKNRIMLVMLFLGLSCVVFARVDQKSTTTDTESSVAIAIEFVKQNPKIKAYLKNKDLQKYSIEFNQVKLGGVCGFTGCQWRTLVSLVVTAKHANSPSTTILAIVKGRLPAGHSEPTIQFVDFKPMNEIKWLTQF